MGDRSFKCMVWMYKVADFLHLANPRKRLGRIPWKEGMVVVDYGCGPGRYSIPAAERVGPTGKVFALDIQPLAVQMVKEEAGRTSLANVEAILLESYRTPIETSSADRILLIDTLHLIDDSEGLFREIRRLLKPDGMLFMDPGHMKMSKARAIIESTGLFKIEKSFGNDMVIVPGAAAQQSAAQRETYGSTGGASHPGSADNVGNTSPGERGDTEECEP